MPLPVGAPRLLRVLLGPAGAVGWWCATECGAFSLGVRMGGGVWRTGRSWRCWRGWAGLRMGSAVCGVWGRRYQAGAAGPGDLVRLGRCLRSVAEADEVCWARVPPDLAAAVTVACAWWGSWKAGQWLCWVLSARLEENLSEALGVGAGWLGWAMWSQQRPPRAWWYGTGWMERLGGEFWEKAGSFPDQMVRAAVEASDPDTSPARLRELWRSEDLLVLDLLASHPRTPARVLKGLCDFRLRHQQVWRVAQNTSAPPRVLDWLSKAEPHPFAEWKVARTQWLLAQHPNTPPAALARLSRCGSGLVLSWVASHPNAGRRTLERLAGDERWWVRRPIGWNPSAPDRLIGRLAGDPRREVRAAVAARQGLHGDLLDRLASDRSIVVRASAAGNPDLPKRLVEQLGEDPHPRVRRVIAWREGAPAEVLALLGEDPDRWVKMNVGTNPSTPKKAVARLVADPDERVQSMAAEHPGVPVGALRRLARSKDAHLRWCAAINCSTPADVLERLAQDEDPEIKETAARNPNTPQPALVRLAVDPDRCVRAATAENPAAPIWLIKQLEEDDCAWVFTTAAEALAERRSDNPTSNSRHGGIGPISEPAATAA